MLLKLGQRVWFCCAWIGVAALAALYVIALTWLGLMCVQMLSERRFIAASSLLGVILVIAAVMLYQSARFYTEMRAGMRPSRGGRHDSVELLRRRLWYYGTWTRLAFSALLAIVVILVPCFVGVIQLQEGAYGTAALFLLVGMSLLLLFSKRVLAFRRDVRAGMQSELRRRNYCPHCEYDLRASEARCPECGQLIDGRSDTIER